MNLKERMFERYLEALDIKPKADFRKGRITYADEVTREDVEGSGGFAGFCDAVQGRTNRFKGPRGTISPRERDGREITKMIEEMCTDDNAVGRMLRKGILEQSPELAQRLGYDEGYSLGSATDATSVREVSPLRKSPLKENHVRPYLRIVK
jgi:hypothetical protein